LQRSYERFSSEVLDAASSPVRLHVLKLLVSKGPLPYTEIMYEAKLDPVRDAGKFVYHLKTLRKAGLVSIEKGTKKYSVTELGKILVEFSRDLEEYIAVKRGRLFVRTSRMTIEEFDRTRIARSLVSEARMPQTLADEVAAEAEERLLKFGIVYLSAPLIRELVNIILIERKLEEYRHKLTRLGLPVNDVTLLLREAGQRRLDTNWVQKSAGEKVIEEYVLLDSLPRATIDAHLAGQIHLEDAASWILKPSILFHEAPLFFRRGTPATNPPSSLEDALESILKILRTAEREVSSEQVLDHFNITIAPFIRGLPRQRLQESIRRFMYDLNWDGFSNTLSAQVTLGIDRQIPGHLQSRDAVGPNGKVEGIYADYSREAEELFTTVIDASLEIGNQQPMLNPSIVVRNIGGKIETADDLLNLAFESAAKYSVPNFLIQSSEPNYSISSEGPVLFEDRDGTKGAGAVVGTVQLNVPRAAYEASGKDERFLQAVQSETAEAVKALQLRQQAINERVSEGILPLLAWQANGGAYYDPKRAHGEIGLMGLAEAVKHHTQAELWEKSSLAFAKKLVEAARRAVGETDTRDIRVRIGLHSSPQASARLASIDADKFGFSTVVYQGSKKYPYYNDLPAIPLTQKIPLATRTFVEGELQRSFDGGALLPLMVGTKTDSSALSKVSREISDAGMRYFTFSRQYSRCQHCYNTSVGVRARCDNCGFERLTILAKLGGRLLPLDTWSEARKRDLDRIVSYDFS
jgi:anaerobic ribonucleoside-triphosphate reductase/predicted transcriptional regulator